MRLVRSDDEFGLFLPKECVFVVREMLTNLLILHFSHFLVVFHSSLSILSVYLFLSLSLSLSILSVYLYSLCLNFTVFLCIRP